DLDGIFQYLIQWQWSARQPIGKRLAFEILHHEIVHIAVMADIVKRADVRMVQRSDRLRFALESCLDFRPGGNLLEEHLDSDGAVQPRITSFVHLPHSSRAKRRKDFVGAKMGTGSKRHKAARL